MKVVKWIFRIIGFLIGLAILGLFIWLGVQFGQSLGLI